MISEDSNSGYEFFTGLSSQRNITCISANGKSNIMNVLQRNETVRGTRLIIVDGAAFGSEMKEVSECLAVRSDTVLYAPESFEWILLSVNVIPDVNVSAVLSHPEAYIDSKEYVSWEQFFTKLLMDKTRENRVWSYSKKKLPQAYLSPKVLSAVRKFMKLIVWNE